VVLTMGFTGRWGVEDGLVMMDRSKGGLEPGCDTRRARRGDGWVQYGTGGWRGSSWAFYIGWGRLAERSGGGINAGAGEWSLKLQFQL
jgi:hypothetical protein